VFRFVGYLTFVTVITQDVFHVTEFHINGCFYT